MHPFKNVKKSIIPYGNLPRGNFVELNGVFRWDGDLCWLSSHGDSSALWVAGHMVEAYNVKLPSKEMVEEVTPSEMYGRIFHYTDINGTTHHGTLKVYGSDISFNPVQDAIKYIKWTPQSLPGILLASEPMREAVKDKEFAIDLYGALCLVEWEHKVSGKQFLASWISAADVVAQLRGLGEVPLDYVFNGNEGFISPEVEALMMSIGWKSDQVHADPYSQNNTAKNIVEICEERYPQKTPFWYTLWISGMSTGDDLAARIHRAAFIGRVSIEEWFKFWQIYKPDVAD